MSTKSGIPEKIKIGETEYEVKDHPELLKAFETVRTEEKGKLYSKIAGFEAKITVLEDEKKANGDLTATKEKELKTLQDELAKTKAEKAELEKVDPKKGAKKDDKKDGDDFDTKLAEALKKQGEAFELKLKEVQGGLTKKTIGDYRKEQLEKNKGLLIEDLVPEDLATEADVNKAIETALAKSKPYIRKDYDLGDGKKQTMSIAEYETYEAEKKAKGDGAGGAGGGTPDYTPGAPARPAGGATDITGKDLLANVDKMSPAEYEKNREAILQQVKQVDYADQ